MDTLWDASAIKKPVRFARCARRCGRISPQAWGTLRGQVHLGSAFQAYRCRATAHLAICHHPLYDRQGSRHKFLAVQPHMPNVHHCGPVHGVRLDCPPGRSALPTKIRTPVTGVFRSSGADASMLPQIPSSEGHTGACQATASRAWTTLPGRGPTQQILLAAHICIHSVRGRQLPMPTWVQPRRAARVP